MKIFSNWWNGKAALARSVKVGARRIIVGADDQLHRHWTFRVAHSIARFVGRNETAFLVAALGGLGWLAMGVNGIGRRTRNNALARPAVGLVWPPQSEADYSLLVGGHATVIGESLRITPTRAVLHRPGPSPTPNAPGTCGADCVELSLTSQSKR